MEINYRSNFEGPTLMGVLNFRIEFLIIRNKLP